ncbi:MAG: YbhB/YbcL family Raf kinase inhibitor-like protein [Mycobacterium sp.]
MRVLHVAVALLAVLMVAQSAHAFVLMSTAFADGAAIPARHTCEGVDVSPPLAWGAPPPGTKGFALIVDDPDAPDPAAPRPAPWVHWVLYGLPADARSLPEGVSPVGLPPGTRAGTGDLGGPDYQGPCPPVGRHRYVFRLYALDTPLPDLGAANKTALLDAMRGHVLGTATLTGTYQKTPERP